MFDKILIGCAAAMCAMTLSCGVVNAEQREVEADGEYRLGDNDTRAQAREYALNDAMKNAVEQVAVHIESRNVVEDYQLTQMQIQSYVMGRLQIKSRTFDYPENGTVCTVHIVAAVEINEDDFKNMPKLDPVKPSEPVTKPDDNELKPFEPVYNPNIVKHEFFDVEEYDGHFYAVIDEGLDWRDADKYCRNLDGHLVTINSAAEQKFVQGLVFKNGKRNCYWLGAYQHRLHLDKWEWVDGAPFTYSNWADGQPDNLKETALMMYRNPNPLSNSSLGEWNDLAENGTYEAETFFGLNNFGFVCEWDSRAQVRYS